MGPKETRRRFSRGFQLEAIQMGVGDGRRQVEVALFGLRHRRGPVEEIAAPGAVPP